MKKPDFKFLTDWICSEILLNIKEQLSEFLTEHSTSKHEEIMSRKDVINMLKINRSTLYLWTKKGKLKSYGLGNRVYYKRSEVESAMLALN